MSMKKINLLTKVYLDTKPDATAGEVARFLNNIKIALRLGECRDD